MPVLVTLINLLGLLGDPPEVLRGPYLQLSTPTSIRVRWSTDQATVGTVRYGSSPGSSDRTVSSKVPSTNHEVLLEGLTPDTVYYYSVGSPSRVDAGGDASHRFQTHPDPGRPRPTRIWVLGDSGTADASAAKVRDAYQETFGNEGTDLWLMLGDNAYVLGAEQEYQAAVFDMYPEMLRRAVLWPTRGNHEFVEDVYYGLFTLPQNGEAGGLASGTEAYYSFDYANIHFVCLDSEGSDRSPQGAMARWLEQDLAATDQEWILAFWHHPPYSRGSHNSDFGREMVEMRENFVPLLEAGGVDLVLTGHSHSYERSFLIDGHYGRSSTFTDSMKVDAGDGREAGDGAYSKRVAPRSGAVYCVAGCSGRIQGGPFNHPAMVHSIAVLGSVVLKIDGPRLDLVFLDADGHHEDHMTLIHRSANRNSPRAPAQLPRPADRAR